MGRVVPGARKEAQEGGGGALVVRRGRRGYPWTKQGPDVCDGQGSKMGCPMNDDLGIAFLGIEPRFPHLDSQMSPQGMLHCTTKTIPNIEISATFLLFRKMRVGPNGGKLLGLKNA